MLKGTRHSAEAPARIARSVGEGMRAKWNTSWGIRRKRDTQASKVSKLAADLEQARLRLGELDFGLAGAIESDVAAHRRQISELSSELGRDGSGRRAR